MEKAQHHGPGLGGTSSHVPWQKVVTRGIGEQTLDGRPERREKLKYVDHSSVHTALWQLPSAMALYNKTHCPCNPQSLTYELYCLEFVQLVYQTQQQMYLLNFCLVLFRHLFCLVFNFYCLRLDLLSLPCSYHLAICTFHKIVVIASSKTLIES